MSSATVCQTKKSRKTGYNLSMKKITLVLKCRALSLVVFSLKKIYRGGYFSEELRSITYIKFRHLLPFLSS